MTRVETAPRAAAPASRAISPSVNAAPLSSEARRQRLLLLCELDRTRMRLLWRLPDKPKPASSSLAAGLLAPATLAAILPWLPGRIGRWSRRIRVMTTFVRAVLRAAA